MIARVVFTGLLVIYCVVDLVDSCKLPVSRSPEYELGDLKCVYLQVEQVDPES